MFIMTSPLGVFTKNKIDMMQKVGVLLLHQPLLSLEKLKAIFMERFTASEHQHSEI